MEAARRFGLVVIGVVAVAVWFVMAPEAPERTSDSLLFSADYGDQIDLALADYDLNNILADSAPQQEVVNGWVTKDLLTIMAYQNADLLVSVEDERVPALLLLGVLAIVWFGLTAPSVGATRKEEVATSPPPPAPASQ